MDYAIKLNLPSVRATLAQVWPVVLGLMVMYIPTFIDLATGLWGEEDHAHGPIIFGLALWLIARQWKEMLRAATSGPSIALGGAVFLFGMLLYIIGRSQSILLWEVGSFIVVLTAVTLLIWGRAAVKVQWFPLFFMLFMIPLPGGLVDAVTLPMKTAVSIVAEHVLFWAGYSVARSGVILQVGQYQMMVADACAGLHTLLTLEALGLFYLNVVRHTSAFRNIVLACLIIPISFTANVIRVLALILITYHFGDAAGQGFLHGFAGMVLFFSALILIIAADALLQKRVTRGKAVNRAMEGRAT